MMDYRDDIEAQFLLERLSYSEEYCCVDQLPVLRVMEWVNGQESVTEVYSDIFAVIGGNKFYEVNYRINSDIGVWIRPETVTVVEVDIEYVLNRIKPQTVTFRHAYRGKLFYYTDSGREFSVKFEDMGDTYSYSSQIPAIRVISHIRKNLEELSDYQTG